MAFSPKAWKNESESKTTPLSAAALIDLEERLGKWAEEAAAAAISALSVGTSQIANLAVTAAKLAEGAVTGPKIGEGAVSEEKLATAVIAKLLGSGNVGTTNLAAEAVTGAKIAGSAIAEGKLGNNAVTAVKLAAGAVTEEKLASEAVGTGKIKALAVTEEKLAEAVKERLNASPYRSLLNASTRQSGGAASTIYLFSGETDKASPYEAAGGALSGARFLYYIPADQAVVGKTTKMMLRATTIGGTTAATIKAGLYPATVESGNVKLGTVVTGSQVEFVAPEAGLKEIASGDFTPPAEGLYIFGYTVSATVGGGRNLNAQLYARNV